MTLLQEFMRIIYEELVGYAFFNFVDFVCFIIDI